MEFQIQIFRAWIIMKIVENKAYCCHMFTRVPVCVFGDLPTLTSAGILLMFLQYRNFETR